MSERARFLWLPGWSVGPEVWSEVIRGCDITCDFAGCERPDDFLETALAALAEPVAVVGWSLGAMVALELARDRPEQVTALYLVGATDCFVAGWPERVLRRMSARLEDDRAAVLDAFDRLMFSQSERAARGEERWIAGRNGFSQPLATLRAGLDYLSRFVADAAAARVPAFLLHGSDDAICPLEGAQRLAAMLPDARLSVWHGAGHAPFWTQPERFGLWLHECARS